ncbi:MAG: alpha/beta fold hydrolase [Pseudomonadota bacterium]
MKKFKIQFTFLIITFVSSNVFAKYKSETEILFEAKNGQSSIAFEGSIMVPENRNKKDSRLIPIKYVRFPATGKKKGSPIIYLAGGPGGSGILTAKYRRFPLFMMMREFGDVIALDQRGTGASDVTPECLSSVVVDHSQVMSDEKYINLHQKALKECLNFWDDKRVDIYGYTTVENVKDLEALRKYFKADKISLWGISYGSHMALSALKTMSDRLDKVIIASAEGLSQTVKMPARTDAYFVRLQRTINSQESSKKMFGDIKALITRVHEKFEKEPLKLRVPLDKENSFDFILQRRDMQEFASGLISDPVKVKMLLQLYLALDNNMTDPVIAVIKKYFKPNQPITFKAMSIAMDLASGMSQEKRGEIKGQAKTALLKDYLNFSYHLTDVFPSIDLGDSFRQKPSSSVPTLLFSGTLDGRTYIESQLEAVSELSNLTAITVNNAGHNLFMFSSTQISPDVEKSMRAFMVDNPIDSLSITVTLPDFAKF